MKKKIFTLIMLLVVVAFIYGAWIFAINYLNRGKNLNKTAWEATYTERYLPVPESGPREGYWGSRVGIGTPDVLTVWHDSETHISRLIDVDSAGHQHYQSREGGNGKYRVVILGGSVASGAYASSIRTTYFNVIGKRLEELGVPTDIDIVAAGAWKSIQEIKALERFFQASNPDVVVFLDGLNDLTNGATSRHLYGEPFKTSNGESADPIYHSHDYEQRVSDYLANMAVAQKLTAARNSDMLVVLQPSLNERAHRTAVEEKLLAASLVPHTSSLALTTSYEAIKRQLALMSRAGGFAYLDGSNLFDSEKETVFADIWHFSDVGHRVLGSVIADKIAEILNKRKLLRIQQSDRAEFK
jgi:lysophospholipase L1-like esterase